MQIFPPPLHEPLVDSKGNATDAFGQWLSRLVQQQQIHLGDDGYLVPHKTSTELSSVPTTKTSNLVYDTDRNKLTVNINGTVVGITTAPL